MKALAIDTTSSSLVIALIDGDKKYTSLTEVGKSGHSSLIVVAIDELLKKANVNIKDINCFGVVVGPGSFTGIRIGVSCITAFAFANNAKRVAISSFELIALDKNKITASIDAGHGNLYLADCENGKIVSTKFVEAGEKVDSSKFDTQSKYKQDEALIKVFESKIQANEFVDVLEPYYMRKSQAEREKDEI